MDRKVSEHVTKLSRLKGLNGAAEQLGVLLPMVVLSVQRRTLLRPDLM